MKYLVVYTYKKGEEVGTGTSFNCEFAHDPPTADDVRGMQRYLARENENDIVIITNWLQLSCNPQNCYNCGYGSDGEEVDDHGHCWLHNGEADFEQPDKNLGCDEWKQMEER